LYGAGSTFFSAFPGWGTKREISEFGKQLHEEYVRMEKMGRSVIDRGPRNTRYVWPFIEEFQKDFNTHESKLKEQGRKPIGLNAAQLWHLTLAYVRVVPYDWPIRPLWRGWSLDEHEQLRDLLVAEL
jgi:hypothetical protein